jgi:hypothetical protein
MMDFSRSSDEKRINKRYKTLVRRTENNTERIVVTIIAILMTKPYLKNIVMQGMSIKPTVICARYSKMCVVLAAKRVLLETGLGKIMVLSLVSNSTDEKSEINVMVSITIKKEW